MPDQRIDPTQKAIDAEVKRLINANKVQRIKNKEELRGGFAMLALAKSVTPTLARQLLNLVRQLGH